MAFEPGGIADKLGNRYEGRWIAKQLLRLLNEEIRSVTIEAIGDDERGVDLWVEQNSGGRQAQQCKARNRSEESWSVSDLKSRGILEHAKNQLSTDINNSFALVSAVGALNFHDLCESARNSDQNAENFYRHQVEAISHKRREGFQQFCTAIRLNPENESDREQAFQYLKRIHLVLYADDHNNWNNLLAEAGYLLTGAPEAVVSSLISYAENNYALRRPIYSDELREHLATLNFQPKNLAHDLRIAPVLEELQRQFEESIGPQLICGEIIPREETEQLIHLIKEGKDIILHGKPGNGKSVVLYELAQYLRRNGIPFLPVRLDRREARNTANQFGQDMGLPDSPVHCLSAIAGERHCVLLLDQLDAIRWTSTHATNSLDVCKELLRQLNCLRFSGKNITAVMSCRTFDLENDPEIRNWLATDKTFAKVEVTTLSSSKLSEILGSSVARFTHRQTQILTCPQNLAMWMLLKDGDSPPAFRSVTELMRCYWQNRLELLENAGFTITELDGVLKILLDEMERRGSVSVTSRVLSRYPKIYAALQSFGIVQENNSKLTFCHQSYLDYLIADRLLRQIGNREGDIVNWLGPKERQSLFRREQLRQALAMMNEEMPTEFFKAIKSILESDTVRFHIKHVVLELVGQLDDPDEELRRYCISLLESNYWKSHILETVCLGHAFFIDLLIKENVISEWLKSTTEDDVNRALWLLRSVNDKIPDIIADILEPFIGKDDSWPPRILSTLCWNAVDDSDRMFQLRLRLVRKGSFENYTNWEALCKKHPIRALTLIEGLASTWSEESPSALDEIRSAPMDRADQLYDQDFKALKDVAETHADEVWNLFVPHIVRLTDFKPIPQYDRRLEKWQKDSESRLDKYTNIRRAIVDLVIVAGSKLAENMPDELLNRTARLEENTSVIIQEILIAIYSHLPANYADSGVRWLISDPVRFQLGPGYDEPTWMPAVRLVKALSPYCSVEMFRALEYTIVSYHAEDEKRSAQHDLRAWRDGYFDDYWGRAQHFLLPVLDSSRVLSQTHSLVAVLNRKYENYNEHRFLRCHPISGGWIGSKLDKSLDRISDRSWLAIIKSKDIPVSHGKWVQVDENHAVTATIEQFAYSLGKIAKRFPERFGQLALHFPLDTHPYYVAAIIDALAKNSADADMPEAEKPGWAPASIPTAEALLDRFKADHDRDTAISFCRLLRARSEENWSDTAIQRLINYAKHHADLEANKLNIHCDKTAQDATVQMLYQNTINCVRGVAAEAIGALLWHHVDWLEKLGSGIDALIGDYHPVVQMAAIDAIMPVLNINKDLAVNWFCQACKDDLRIAASPRALLFFNYSFNTHAEQLTPLIQAMINSPLEEVSQEGAEEVTARWLFQDLFEDELRSCRNGTIPQRKGVTQVAAHFLQDEKYFARCQELLIPLINDPDEGVRKEAAKMARNPNFLKTAINRDFIHTYVNSKAYIDNSSSIVNDLKEFAGSLLPLSEIIFDVCKIFSTTLLEKTRDASLHIPHSVSEIYSVLLRLYEQAENDTKTRNQCLDIWDMLFENRVGIVQELTKSIER